jgi:KaiC/GvpD/RAD55 family RecA-like ATPase
VDRVSTGVKGFDDLVEGGFVPGSIVLITGVPGTGKTIFGLQYIYSGAMNAEPGIYVCVESSPTVLKAQALKFGMDFEKLEAEKKVYFLVTPKDNNKFNMFKMIDDAARRLNAKRIVFDNLATFDINIGKFVSLWGPDTPRMIMQSPTVWGDKVSEKIDEKMMAYSIIEQLRIVGLTSVIITFGDESAGKLTVDGVSEFLSDGIVQLSNTLIGTRHIRTLMISKMRNTNHSQHIHNFDIKENGIVVEAADEVYK